MLCVCVCVCVFSDFKIAKGVVVCSEVDLYGDVTIGRTSVTIKKSGSYPII